MKINDKGAVVLDDHESEAAKWALLRYLDVRLRVVPQGEAVVFTLSSISLTALRWAVALALDVTTPDAGADGAAPDTPAEREC